jgi:hypothetical protein
MHVLKLDSGDWSRKRKIGWKGKKESRRSSLPWDRRLRRPGHHLRSRCLTAKKLLKCT